MAQPALWARRFHAPRRADAPPLVICPHAGAGASAYQRFSEAFSATFVVTVLQYPARQDRAGEPPEASVTGLARGALAEWVASRPGTAPLTVFGHSMGGLVAFELARAAEAAGLPVARLVVSSVLPADLVAGEPPHPTEDEAVLDRLARLGGTDAAILADRDVMRLALPALRADYAAGDAYACDPGAAVAAPVLALGGDDDPIVPPGVLHGWGRHTTGGVTVSVFPGGHFYLNAHVELVAETLAAGAPAVAGGR